MSMPPKSMRDYLLTGVDKPTLDSNPALGSIQRMQLIANARPQKELTKADSPETIFDALFKTLARLDKAMTGNSPQGFGLQVYGKSGTSEGSTAAKATKDAVFLSSCGVDFKELTEQFDLLDNVMGGDLYKAISGRTDGLFTTWSSLAAEDMFKLRGKLNDIKEALEEEKKARSGKVALLPLKFGTKGVHDDDFKFWVYYLLALNGQGYFMALPQEYEVKNPSKVHKIVTNGTKLFDLKTQIAHSRQIRSTYLDATSYEYAGDDKLRILLPRLTN